ncbi:MAG: hypothetical protein P8M22_01800 [Phycisphaerales bacterium]|nr:hypothetical protein [Phycisphaerales bacterium]
MIEPLSSLPLSASNTTNATRQSDEVSEEVTIEDIIRNWGEADSHADLNDDGIVDVNDLLLLLEQQSSSNPVINALTEAPLAAAEGLASLGSLLMESLGMQVSDRDETFELPETEATESLGLDGLETADVDQAMKTAKGMLDRWQSRGYTTEPPPGFEQVIETLPLDMNIRAVVAKLIEASYAG